MTTYRINYKRPQSIFRLLIIFIHRASHDFYWELKYYLYNKRRGVEYTSDSYCSDGLSGSFHDHLHETYGERAKRQLEMSIMCDNTPDLPDLEMFPNGKQSL